MFFYLKKTILFCSFPILFKNLNLKHLLIFSSLAAGPSVLFRNVILFMPGVKNFFKRFKKNLWHFKFTYDIFFFDF